MCGFSFIYTKPHSKSVDLTSIYQISRAVYRLLKLKGKWGSEPAMTRLWNIHIRTDHGHSLVHVMIENGHGLDHVTIDNGHSLDHMTIENGQSGSQDN